MTRYIKKPGLLPVRVFHFEALKLWGTPPLVVATFKSLNELSVPNATKDALYTQILADFGVAFTNLPAAWDGGNTGRATKWAARAYVGKVNVWKNDMDAAITAFEDVITNGVGAAGKYELIDTNNPAQDLEDVFAFDNENNKESIFEVQFGLVLKYNIQYRYYRTYYNMYLKDFQLHYKHMIYHIQYIHLCSILQ